MLTPQIEQRLQEKLKGFCGEHRVMNEPDVREILQEALEEKEEEKNKAYYERNQLVRLLTKIYPAWRAVHSKEDKNWDEDWMNIIYIETPLGQASWHIHYSEFGWFEHLPVRENSWDGHTFEEKYRRLGKIKSLKAEEKKEENDCIHEWIIEDGNVIECKNCRKTQDEVMKELEKPVPSAMETYLDLNDEEKGELVQKATEAANREQKELMEGENWREEYLCKYCKSVLVVHRDFKDVPIVYCRNCEYFFDEKFIKTNAKEGIWADSEKKLNEILKKHPIAIPASELKELSREIVKEWKSTSDHPPLENWREELAILPDHGGVVSGETCKCILCEWKPKIIEAFEAQALRHEKEKAALHGTVNGTPCFEWMEQWLSAYQKQNKDIDVKKVMRWIDDQPMCS